MGQVRKTKTQIMNECREVYKLRSAGNSYEWICNKLGIKKRNFFKTHYPVLSEMAAEENKQQFSQEEMGLQDRILRERLELYHQICLQKAMEKGASPDWIKAAVNIDVLLTRLRHEGLMAFNLNEYRQITQRMGGLVNESGTDVLQAGTTEETPDTESTV